MAPPIPAQAPHILAKGAQQAQNTGPEAQLTTLVPALGKF
jgi:hypothetical protein